MPHTILSLSEPGLEIVQGQVRHSVFEIVHIHVDGYPGGMRSGP